MSHSKERNEKNCLNCGAEVAGRYCQVCGQENIATKESFGHLLSHFFNDITHFDGKFFESARYLLTQPGKLTYEYVSGRRVRYLNPIRMYVFTSAFFFLLYFSFVSPHKEVKQQGLKAVTEKLEEKEQSLTHFQQLANIKDTAIANAAKRNITKTAFLIAQLKDSVAKLQHKTLEKKQDTTDLSDGELITLSNLQNTTKAGNDSAAAETLIAEKADKTDTLQHTQPIVALEDKDLETLELYKTEDVYLAMQEELPASRRDGLLEKGATTKLLHWLSEEGGAIDGKGASIELIEKFKHSFPTLLFVSLPLVAFLLKLLYIRQRRQFYYGDHGIFTLHLYCGIFILLLLFYLISGINDKWHWWGLSALKLGMVVYLFYYGYKAMRFFYGQGRWKTLLKYLLLNGMTFIVMVLLMSIFFVITAARA